MLDPNAETCDVLSARHCVPCEGGVPRLSEKEVARLISQMPEWKTTHDGERIRREWTTRNFQAALDFITEVGRVAEDEQHHPDIHLTSYRQVAIEIYTHAIGGLSENDFIVAAKIDQLQVRLKK